MDNQLKNLLLKIREDESVSKELRKEASILLEKQKITSKELLNFITRFFELIPLLQKFIE